MLFLCKLMAIIAILSCSLNAIKKSPLENNKNNLAKINKAYQSKFDQNIGEDIDIKKLISLPIDIAISQLIFITTNSQIKHLNDYIKENYNKLRDPNIPQNKFNNYLSNIDAHLMQGTNTMLNIQHKKDVLNNFYKLLIIWNKILELPEIKKRINTGKKPTILDNQRTLAILQSKLIGLHYHD